jgi:hypothetical protein
MTSYGLFAPRLCADFQMPMIKLFTEALSFLKQSVLPPPSDPRHHLMILLSFFNDSCRLSLPLVVKILWLLLTSVCCAVQWKRCIG